VLDPGRNNPLEEGHDLLGGGVGGKVVVRGFLTKEQAADRSAYEKAGVSPLLEDPVKVL
jgi:hypothetical protein